MAQIIQPLYNFTKQVLENQQCVLPKFFSKSYRTWNKRCVRYVHHKNSNISQLVKAHAIHSSYTCARIYACICISACTYCWPEQINLKLPDLTLTVEIVLGSELTHEHANLKLKKINKYRRRRRRRRRVTENWSGLPNWTQKGASSDSSQTSALPLEASSTSSSIESLIYSLCAKRSHSVNVGFSRSCSCHNIVRQK